MAFVNTGALVNGRRPATKAELKRALASDPASVVFDSTAMMGPHAGEDLTVETLKAEPATTFSVVGPDPYTRRNWYASVKANGSGKVVVS